MMIRKYGLLILMLLAGIAILVAVIKKDDLSELISQGMKNQATTEEKFNAQKYVSDHFDYADNQLDFDYSILEFKSSGCTICKQMEPELEKIKKWDEERVNVVVIQIMNPDSQEMMKYFGISAVPTHIVLDKKGKEFFRKYGFISADELKTQILTNQQNKS